MKLIIQIPAYNEEATIGATIADLPKRIDGITKIETLLIDDGSSDKTIEAARRAGITHVVKVLNHRGLSTAFTTGIDTALRLGADIIVNTDADNQYRGSDIAKMVRPILAGEAEVVIGDRVIRNSPHMSGSRKLLQRFGSWSVGRASGISIPDVTSGLRAFSREAAFQINVFNPFTYTLETIIQAGNRNLQVMTVPVSTNPPTRPSRLYRGVGSYLRKSIVTIFRIYTLYKPLKTFSLLAAIQIIAGLMLGFRFLYFFFNGDAAGHVQSLILMAILLILGFQTFLIGLVSDLISVNRRLSEEVLVRMRKLAPAESRPLPVRGREIRREPARRDPRPAPRPASPRPSQPAAAKPAQQTQWVWLLNEGKLEGGEPRKQRDPAGTSQPASATPVLRTRPPRRRRRRRAPGVMVGEGAPPAAELPDKKEPSATDEE